MTAMPYPAPIDPELIAAITRACEDREGRPIKGGRELRFRCPVHAPDVHPSARWDLEQAIWHCDACQAGGGAIALADLLGINRERRDGPTSPRPTRPPIEPVRPVQPTPGPKPTRPSGPRRIVATYPYGDGRQVVRFDPKSFMPRHLVDGHWRNGRPDPESWPLYRQDELPNDLTATVHVTEGEKDADTLAGLGWCAVSPGSSGTTWQDAWTEALAGRPVVIHADNDPPGRKRAVDLSGILQGRATSVRIAGYDDLPHGGDVSDFLAANDAAALAARIDRLAPLSAAPEPVDDRQLPARMAVVRTMADIEAREIDWLWRAWIPRGKVSILGGHPGDGKSTIALALASTLSRGGTLPDGQRAPVTSTLLLLAEDDLADTVRPRIDVHGGDAARIHAIEVVREPDGRERFVSLADHVPELREQIDRHDIGFLVIDPLTAFLPKADRNAEGDVRDALMPLLKLAGETGVAVLGIMHIGKATGTGRKPLQTLLGSTAFGAIARAVLMTADLPEDKQPPKGEDGQRDTHKLLGVVKSNVAQRPAAWTWCRPMDGPIRWLGRSELSVEDVIAGEPAAKPIEAATEFLQETLARHARFAEDVLREAQDRGIAEKTLRRAQREIGVVPIRSKGQGSRWVWALPGQSTEVSGEDGHSVGPENVAIFPAGSEIEDGQPENVAIFPEESEDGHPATSGQLLTADGPEGEDGHNPYIGHVAIFPQLNPELIAGAHELAADLRAGGPEAIASFRADLETSVAARSDASVSALTEEDEAAARLALRLAGSANGKVPEADR